MLRIGIRISFDRPYANCGSTNETNKRMTGVSSAAVGRRLGGYRGWICRSPATRHHRPAIGVELLSAGSNRCLKRVCVLDGYLAAFDLKNPFGLKLAQISGTQYTDGANLESKLLVIDAQRHLNPAWSFFSGIIGLLHQPGCKAIADGGERKFLDDPH